MSELANAIQKQFTIEQIKRFGDTKPYILIEPQEEKEEKENQIKYKKDEVKNRYHTIFKKPSNYCCRNDWAFLSMDILNQFQLHNLTLDNDAIHIAVNEGFPSIVNKVLQFKNIDVNSKGFNGRTPLHSCLISLNPNMKILCILIEAGADFSAKDNDGNTPLNIIMLFWNKKNQQWLPLLILDYLPNYDYTMVNNRGENILEYAKMMECQESIIKKIESKLN